MMIRLNATLLAVVAMGAVGCSEAPTLKGAPVGISGRVAQGGKPLGNVVVWFHPLDNGHLQNLLVNSDGTFHGELVGGAYSYYLGKSPAPNSALALQRVNPKYFEPDMRRTINVEFSKEITLALD
jgi:hypothetical protein